MFETKGHTKEAVKTKVGRKSGEVAGRSVCLDLPIVRVSVPCRKYCRVAERVDIFVHPWDGIGVPCDHCGQLSVDDTGVKGPSFSSYHGYSRRTLCVGRLYTARIQQSADILHLELPHGRASLIGP